MMKIIFKKKKGTKKKQKWPFFNFFKKYFFPFQFCAFKSAFRIFITPIKKFNGLSYLTLFAIMIKLHDLIFHDLEVIETCPWAFRIF